MEMHYLYYCFVHHIYESNKFSGNYIHRRRFTISFSMFSSIHRQNKSIKCIHFESKKRLKHLFIKRIDKQYQFRETWHIVT